MPALTRPSVLFALIALTLAACYGNVGSLCDDNYCADAGFDARSEGASTDSPSGDGPAPDAIAEDGGEGSAGCTSPTILDCNGTCVDPTLPTHCGTCSNVCTGPDTGTGQATCTAGTCGLGCSGSTSLNCGGSCVDPSTPEHCGNCTNACPAPGAGSGAAICTLGSDGGGTCSVTCSGSTTEACGGSCYAPTDPNHCGSCTNACPPPPSGNGQASCASPPTCGLTCATNYHECSADCLPNSDEPSDTADPCALTEAFGVFVAPSGSDSTGAGTRAAPYATIGHAMDQAKLGTLTRIYACGTAGHYTENIVVDASRSGLTVYGGLDCTTTPGTWTYKPTDLATIAPATVYAAQITTAVTFEDMGFVAATMASATASTSSIAVFVSGATGVTLERCTVDAGPAAPGASPMQPPPYTSVAPTGNTGGAPIASGGTGMGGAELANSECPTSIGGAGGSAKLGESPSLLDGQSGQPGTASNGGTSLACGTSEQGGSVGVAGASGSPGTAATTWATFSTSGWTPSSGTTAGQGSVGQGGGGGGTQAATNGIGGGGGGGAGGCGGTGGTGGGGGGSSVGLLVLDSSVTLLACSIASSNGGQGGNGAGGQTGQTGGAGGAGGTAGCTGGMGGAGGNGGPGGGGAGGLSAGILWSGTAPTTTGGTQTYGSAGAAGTNGDGSTTAKAGTAGAIVQFQ